VRTNAFADGAGTPLQGGAYSAPPNFLAGFVERREGDEGPNWGEVAIHGADRGGMDAPDGAHYGNENQWRRQTG